MRRLTPLLPGGLAVLAVGAVLLVEPVREIAPLVAALALYLVSVSGILLGLRFGNVRLVSALIVVLFGHGALEHAPAHAAGTVAAAVTVLVPLNLAALAWTPDGARRGLRIQAWALAIGAQAAGLAMLWLPDRAEAARSLWQAVVEPVQARWPLLDRLALLAGGAAVLAVVARFALRSRPVEAGLAWATGAAVAGLGAGTSGAEPAVPFTAGALALLVAVVESSHALAYRDELTGLPTRRALNELLGSVGPRYAVAMVDVDHFKQFNDTHGHQAGDQLLRKVAATLMQVSGGGRAFRYGGEEFAVVFPGATAAQAAPHMEAVREAIAGSAFTVRAADRPRGKPRRGRSSRGRARVSVTVSVGVADSRRGRRSADEVVKAADAALYRAKHAGRNRLVC